MLNRLWCYLFGCITMRDVFVGRTVEMTSVLTGALHTVPITRKEKLAYCPRCSFRIDWDKLNGKVTGNEQPKTSKEG